MHLHQFQYLFTITSKIIPYQSIPASLVDLLDKLIDLSCWQRLWEQTYRRTYAGEDKHYYKDKNVIRPTSLYNGNFCTVKMAVWNWDSPRFASAAFHNTVFTNTRCDEIKAWKRSPHYWPFVRETTSWFPSQRGFEGSFDVFPVNLNKQSKCRWFQTPRGSCDVTAVTIIECPILRGSRNCEILVSDKRVTGIW